MLLALLLQQPLLVVVVLWVEDCQVCYMFAVGIFDVSVLLAGGWSHFTSVVHCLRLASRRVRLLS